ncbi:MAG: ribokinase [Fimbriimonadaceae bacterium]|nr:ribokinase [Fimbriimonadaceae bacterium]
MVVVVGSANMDLVARVPRFPEPGETIHGREFATYPGGKGANQAVAVGKLGGRVAFVGKVGRDAFGDALEASLNSAGVDTDLLARSDAPTGTAIILVDDRAENQIVVIGGANATLTPTEAERCVRSLDARVALFQLETPLETVAAGLAEAKRRGMTTILNPAPAVLLPAEILASVDILTPNRTEAGALAGLSDAEPEALIAALLDLGVGAVAMTRGKDGCVFGTRDRTIAIPSVDVRAVDTTAAGDAFNGALALFLAEGRPVEQAIAGANRVGALAATKPGAQTSMPTRAELEALDEVRGIPARFS